MLYIQEYKRNYFLIKGAYIESGVSLEAASLFLQGRSKDVYILPSSDPTSALLLVGFTEYDDDDDDDDDDMSKPKRNKNILVDDLNEVGYVNIYITHAYNKQLYIY
ncbi:hypothetical protein Hanom_Chr17g01525941 [Helianthus anomalus]